MGSIRLPGGYRITDVPEVPDDFTPTAEEMFWAAVMPPNLYRMYTDKSGETSFYFAVKVGASAVALLAAEGQSLSAFLLMKSGSSFVRTVSNVPRLLAPEFIGPLLPVAGLAGLHHAAGTSFDSTASNFAVASGQPGAQRSKPWWMPLPVYVALYS